MNRARTISTPRLVLGLAGWLLVSFAASAVGGMVTDAQWYETLNRPPWAPEPAVFGPVWTVLYILIALSAWLVWQRTRLAGAPVAFTLFFVQHALNALWSYLFFGLRNPGLAFAEIVVLFAAIVATIVAFWRIRPVAGALLIPYLLWVGFAATLTFSLWRMNP